MKQRYIITNGELGTLDQTVVTYSRHGNGQRALKAAIQHHADRTGRESWAILAADYHTPPNRFYPRKPTN